jgi:hypothetical protein
VSRGPSKTQRQALAFLVVAGRPLDVTRELLPLLGLEPTKSARVSLLRAMRLLERRGVLAITTSASGNGGWSRPQAEARGDGYQELLTMAELTRARSLLGGKTGELAKPSAPPAKKPAASKETLTFGEKIRARRLNTPGAARTRFVKATAPPAEVVRLQRQLRLPHGWTVSPSMHWADYNDPEPHVLQCSFVVSRPDQAARGFVFMERVGEAIWRMAARPVKRGRTVELEPGEWVEDPVFSAERLQNIIKETLAR